MSIPASRFFGNRENREKFSWNPGTMSPVLAHEGVFPDRGGRSCSAHDRGQVLGYRRLRLIRDLRPFPKLLTGYLPCCQVGPA